MAADGFSVDSILDVGTYLRILLAYLKNMHENRASRRRVEYLSELEGACPT